MFPTKGSDDASPLGVEYVKILKKSGDPGGPLGGNFLPKDLMTHPPPPLGVKNVKIRENSTGP